MMDAMLLHFEDEALEAEQLARAAGLARAAVGRNAVTRDELSLQLPPALPSQVVLYRNLATRRQGLLELLLFERLAVRQGVDHLLLVAPGVDIRGDLALSGFLAGLFDELVLPASGGAAARAENHSPAQQPMTWGWSAAAGASVPLCCRLGRALRQLGLD